MNDARFHHLFSAYFNKTATPEERAELMQMLAGDAHDDALKEALDNAWPHIHPGNATLDPAESDTVIARILAETSAAGNPAAQKKAFWHSRVLQAAAMLILLAGSGYFILMNRQKQRTPAIVQVKPVQPRIGNSILPGGNKAILTLGDGSTITLDSSRAGTLAKQGNTDVLKLNGAALAYNTRADLETETVYNTLSTPKGGQYQLVLPDGSKVWLNASSSIRFPTAFTGKERRVSITGEAYFEVQKKDGMPFTVDVHQVDVRVLGTHFNIMAYDDESSINTTLLEGAVRISHEGSSKTLASGQESRVKDNGNIQVVDADIESVMAWKNGWFLFNGYDIGKIMRQLSRWYNVEVVYEGSIPSGHFSGAVSRSNDIQQVLKILEGSGIHVKISGTKLMVTS